MTENINFIYIGSTAVLVLFIILMFRFIFKPKESVIIGYENNTLEDLEEVLSDAKKIKARASNMTAFQKHAEEIDLAIQTLDDFIKANPSINMCQEDNRVMLRHSLNDDIVGYSDKYRSVAHQTILDMDEIEQSSPMDKFDYLLKHLAFAISILRSEVCDHGKLDIRRLRYTLHLLNDELHGYQKNDKALFVIERNQLE